MATRPEPVNDILRDEVIAHAVQIERLKNAEQKAVIEFVQNSLLPDLTRRFNDRMSEIMARGLDIGPETTARLQRLIQSLNEIVEAWSSGLARDIVARSTAIAGFESQWTTSLLSDQLETVPVRVSTVLPPVEQLRTLILSRPIDGVLVEGWIQRLNSNTKSSLEKQIRLGIASGETTSKITRRVTEVTGFARDSAVALTRTIIGQAASIGRDAVYEANADLLRGVQWHATLDTRTCPRCGKLDGQVFEIGKGPRPVLHLMCRCSSVPVLKSWRQLGIKARDIDTQTRASMDGQVSSSLRFGDWVKRRSAAEQDEILGKTRARLFRSGALEIGDFVNSANEVITLDALKARYSDAFRKAGI